jgi:EF-P beta-lysylation protein EpmB
MVTRSVGPCQTDAWRRDLAQAYRDAAALLADLRIEAREVPDLDPDPGPFALLVPRGFAALMTPGDPQDPLLRQVLPLKSELARTPGYVPDPVGDGPAARVPGLLQKYRGRALLMAHGACAVHCRYCFRRHFPYAELGAQVARTGRALARIAADETLAETILSGGDPLMLDDPSLGDLLERLDAIPHLRRLRLHTRLPVVLPSRVTGRLCAILGSRRLRTVLVIHANHPRELGDAAQTALTELGRAGVALLNQGVLLAGVNDCAETLADLSERLFACRVLPYYLHQLDPVQGAAHFAVSDTCAIALMEDLRVRLPGYLVPRLVREIPGEAFKRPLA